MICGDFLGFELCSSLSSVRLKIRISGTLPEVIPISFRGKEFPVHVYPDSVAPSSLLVSTKEPCIARCSMGISALSPITDFNINSEFFEFGSTSASTLPPTKMSTPTLSLRRPLSGSSPEALSESHPKAFSPSFQRTAVSAESDFSSIIPHASPFVGLRLDGNDNLWLVCSSGQGRTTPILKMVYGLGLHGPNLGFSAFMVSSPGNFGMRGLNSTSPASVGPFIKSVGCKSPTRPLPRILSPSLFSPPPQNNLDSPLELSDLVMPSPQAVVPSSVSQSSSDLSSLHTVVREAAVLFGLELQDPIQEIEVAKIGNGAA
ncbi:hypothetical protein LINPERHAP2_LOCUS8699 [Linum perenne]